MKVDVTDQAYNQLVELGIGGDKFLRLAVKSGGCSGMTYDAFIDNQLQLDDEVVFSKDTVRIAASTDHSRLLDGLHIDYSTDMVNSGFRLSNTNNEHSCGCGASFTPGEGCGSGACP